MRSSLSIAVLSLLLPAASAFASFISKPPAPVEGVLRLADRRLDETRVPGSVTVITAEEIARSGARTLQELLAGALGAVAFDEIGNGLQSSLDLRGFNASPAPALAVLVDGTRVNEATFGQVNYHLIPLESIERLEIHRGPSTLHGKGVLSGVVLISTKRGGPRAEAAAGVEGGSRGRAKGWARVSGTAAGVDYMLAGSKEQDDGFRRHSAADVGTAQLKLGYKYMERSDLSVSFTRADDRLQQPGALTGKEAASDFRQNVSETDYVSRMNFLTVSDRQALPWEFSLALNGHLRERDEISPINRGRSSLSRYAAKQKSRGLAGQLSRESEIADRLVLLSAGAESVESEADSKTSGFFGSFPFESANLSKEVSEGLFAQAVVDLIPETLVLTSGARYEESKTSYEDRLKPGNSGAQSFHRTSPRAGLNYNHPSGARAYAQYSEGFRTPTVNEISVLGPFGRADLRPVKARNYEAGGRLPLGESGELRLSAFHNDVQDEIFPVFDPIQGFGRNINVDRTSRQGLETGLKAAGENWEAFANHTWTQARFENAIVLDKAPWPSTQSVAKGSRLPLVPEHRLALGAAVRPLGGLTLSADGLCQSERTMLGDEANLEPSLPAECVANLGAAYERAAWRLFVNAYNILDNRHAARGILGTSPATFQKEAFVTPAPDFSLRVGVSWRFSAPAPEDGLARR